MMGIYAIRNKINGKAYVGSSQNMRRRVEEHFQALSSGKHQNYNLQQAYDFYGAHNFAPETLEVVEKADLLDKCEQRHLDRQLAGSGAYNIRSICVNANVVDRVKRPPRMPYLSSRGFAFKKVKFPAQKFIEDASDRLLVSTNGRIGIRLNPDGTTEVLDL